MSENPAPMTEKRLTETRENLANARNITPALLAARALLAEVERLRAELDEAQRRYSFDTAELKKRIAELGQGSALLNALQAAGVDNWEGYGYAMELLAEAEE